MTEPTTQDIAKAGYALGKLESAAFAGASTEEERNLALEGREIIFDTLPYKPLPEPSTTDIDNARTALEALTRLALRDIKSPPEKHVINAWVEQIRTALPEPPQPTMADIEWNHAEHFLAEAEHPTHGNVIMINEASDERIQVIIPSLSIPKPSYLFSDNLVPTGRRYTATDE